MSTERGFNRKLDSMEAKQLAEDSRFLMVEMSSWSMPSCLLHRSLLFVEQDVLPETGDSIYFMDSSGKCHWADTVEQVPAGHRILGTLYGVFTYPPAVAEERIEEIRQSLGE